MIVWVLVIYMWGTGDTWHRSAPFYDKRSCMEQAALVTNANSFDRAYCEQVKMPVLK